jgi:hypothetical protein
MPTTRRPLKKVTLQLFEGDFEFLQSYYRDIGGSAIVRELVAIHRAEIESRLTQPAVDSTTVTEIASGLASDRSS